MIVRRLIGLPAVSLVVLAICNLLLLTPVPNVLHSWAAVGLAILLPGLLLVNLLVGQRAEAPGLGEYLAYGVGAGLGLLVLLMLALSYLPGGLSFAQAALSLNALVILLIAGNVITLPGSPSFSVRLPHLDWNLVALAALLLGAALLRFTHLGYSELHGDEALVALRAVDVIQGWERALFIHKKGPGEILTGSAIYLLTGSLTEYAAHLPFALASWAGVLATYTLGRQWFGPVAGWWAGAMVAVDGYLMAFGRMIQYQSVIFLMVVLTVLAVERARQRGQDVTRYLLLAALFLATGLLAHYEAIIAVVPALVLLIALWQKQEGYWLVATRRMARWLALPLLLGAAICAAFYVPYVLDPEFFRDTFAYIFGHRLAGQAAPEVFPTVVGRSTLYSSTYYFWTLVGLTLLGMVRGYRLYTPLWLRVSLALLLVGALAALLVDATAFLSGTTAWLARGIFVLLFAPLWFGRGVPAAERAVWLWFGLPLMGVMFFIAKPGTHVYVFFIPWALVTGMVVGEVWQAVARRWGARPVRWLLAPVMLLLVLVFGNYVTQLFVRNDPEVLLTWDENRPAGYWTSYETPAFESIFGFPIRNGWKSVATLYAQGVMRGRFDTNDRFSMVPDWYLRGEGYCPRDEPNYYLLVPYPLPVDRPLVDEKRAQLAEKYYLWGTVSANERPHMEIYARRDRMAAEQEGSPRIFREEETSAFFDANLLAPFTHNGPLGDQPIPNPTNYRYGEHLYLVGHSVANQEVARGGEIELQLYWRADAPISADYFVSVQAINLQTTGKAGQRDGEPGCNRFPTTTWVPGDTIFDRYHVPIDEDAPPGEYMIYVKMYNEEGALPVTDEHGVVSDGALLTTITVVE
ncbi:MAG: glycosyltransferase family 39 protein [Caldilineaceae bacterium]|nr:glycosyltransferase family 39 protein [Caldilineaceae bacterium]